jgi:hypothetical protein
MLHCIFFIISKLIKKIDHKSIIESGNLNTYAAVTHGVQEILDRSGLKITHVNFYQKYRVVCVHTGVTIDNVSQGQIIKEMENFVDSVPIFIEQLVNKYYQ